MVGADGGDPTPVRRTRLSLHKRGLIIHLLVPIILGSPMKGRLMHLVLPLHIFLMNASREGDS